MKRLPIFVLSILLLAVGCEPETILNVPTTPLQFDADGGTATVDFVANKVWSVSSDASWCKISPGTGDGSENSHATVTLTCAPNTDYDTRSCTVTVNCDDASASIAVSQDASNGLIVSQTTFDLPCEAQQLAIEVRANVDYTAKSDAAWLRVVSAKGLASNTLTLAVDANTTGSARTGSVLVKETSGSLSATVTVNQAQNDVFEVKADQATENLSEARHKITFTVKTNVEYEVVFEDPAPDWISIVSTKGVQTDKITLEVAANNTMEARSKNVTIRQKGGNGSHTFLIGQRCRKDIVFDQSRIELPYNGTEAQEVLVQVEASVEYTLFADEGSKKYVEEIKLVSDLSKTRKQWKVRIKGNEDFKMRVITIIGQATDKSVNSKLSIVQLAPEIKILLNDQPTGGHSESLVGCDGTFSVSVYPEELAKYGYEVTLKDMKSAPQPIRLEKDKEAEGLEWRVYSLCEGRTAITIKFKKANAAATLNWEVKDEVSADPITRQALVAAGVDANYNGIFEPEEIAAVKKLSLSGIMENVLDLAQFTELEDLTLEKVPRLKGELKLTGNTKLKKLTVRGALQLETLNINDNPELNELAYQYSFLNEYIGDKCQKLEKVDFTGTQIAALDFRENHGLQRLVCDSCGLYQLKGNEELVYGSARANNLETVPFGGPKLKEIHLEGNRITDFWFQKNFTSLIRVYISDNQLKEIHATENAKPLEILDCTNNKLTFLDVHYSEYLKKLLCTGNPMTEVRLLAGHKYSLLELPDGVTVTYVELP